MTDAATFSSQVIAAFGARAGHWSGNSTID